MAFQLISIGLRGNIVPNTDYSPVEPLPGLVQAYIKSDLAGAFASKEIVTAVEIDWHGRIEVKKQSWESYWNIKEALPEQDSFLHFEKARDAYFDNNFHLDHLSEYCEILCINKAIVLNN